MERKPMIDEDITTITLPNKKWEIIIEALEFAGMGYHAELLRRKFKTAHSTVHKQGC